MLEDLRENGIFSNHEGHYRLVAVNAQQPDVDLAHDVALTRHRVRPFRAVFLNYLLDNLPATVLQVDDNQVRELYVRTCLAEGVNLDEHTSLNAAEIVARVTSDNPMDRYDLIDLYPLFVLEYNYRSVAVDGVPYGEFAVEFGRQHGQYVLHSYGAMQCIDSLLALLHDQGFILVSDYGQTKPEESAADYLHQRYSGSIAIRLNFALLKAYWIQAGHVQWLEPDEDSGSICTRLLGRYVSQSMAQSFQQRFCKAAFNAADEPVKRARACLKQGATQQALSEYREALVRQPYNWLLVDEVAKFLITPIRNYEAALEMVQYGLELNPSLSASLWNTLGDARFCLDRLDARDAFLRALEIDPQNIRARLSLADYFTQMYDYAAALKLIAEGLVLNSTGEHSSRLLKYQADVLQLIEEKRKKERQILANRVTPFVRVHKAPGGNE